MRSGLRFLVLFGLLACCALATSVPIIWAKTTNESIRAKVIRDPAGSLYHVTRSGTLFNRRLHITKYNPLGVQAWSSTISETSNLENQFNIRGLALTPSSLIIVAHERTLGGAGTFVSSRIYGINLSNGSTSYSATSVLTHEGPATSATQIAVLQRDTATGSASVSFLDTNFNHLGTTSLGATASIGAVAMDSANNAFAACGLANGTTQISRCTSGSLAYQTSFDVPNRNNERPTRIAVDPVANRVYAHGVGIWHAAPNDYDALFYVANLTTGGAIVAAAAQSSTEDDDAYELTVVPGQGVISSMGSVPESMSIRRYSVDGALTWNANFASTPVPSPRSHALDADGNLLVSYPTLQQDTIRISRLNISTGAVLDTQSVFMGTNTIPLQLITDAAANRFIAADVGTSTVLMRVQPADLSFSATNITGGTAVTGRIDLAATAASDQTWTISSSNSSVASVPSSVVIGTSNTFGTFPITVSGVAANTNVSINVRHAGFIAQKTLTVIPSNIQNVIVSPQVVTGGTATTANLTLTGNAPAGGRTVTLASNKPAVATVPTSVDVPAGASTFPVPVTTFGVNSNQGVVITATTGAISKTAFFAVNAPSLASISIDPITVQGGANATLTLNINGPAPTGGFSIVLISGAPGVVFLTASASIPAGTVTHNVNVPTAAVTSSINVTVFATRSGIYKTATLTVTP